MFLLVSCGVAFFALEVQDKLVIGEIFRKVMKKI